MLFVGEGQESCHPLRDTKAITDMVLRQLELAKNMAAVVHGQTAGDFYSGRSGQRLYTGLDVRL